MTSSDIFVFNGAICVCVCIISLEEEDDETTTRQKTNSLKKHIK